MHERTKSGNWKLKVELKYDLLRNGNPSPRAGTWGVGEWDNFVVASEADNFRLTIGSRTQVDNMGSGDPFDSHTLNGMQFSTEEDGRDNDQWSGGSCAHDRKGGWWFNNCVHVCLNCKDDYIWKHNGIWEKFSRSLMWMKQIG